MPIQASLGRRVLISGERHFLHILTAFGVIIVAICWLSLWQYLSRVSADEESNATTQLENMVIAIQRNVENDIGQIDILLKVLQATKRLIGFDRVSLHPMREVFAIKDQVLHVSFTDAAGYVGDNTAFPDNTKRVNIFDREHFRVHVDGPFPGGLYISKPMTGRGTGKHTIQFTRGVYSADGKFEGVMGAGLSPEAFLRGFDVLNLGTNSGIAVVGEDNIVRAASGSFADTIGKLLPLGPPESTRHVKDSTTIISRAAVDGRSQIVATAPVGRYPLKVVVASDAPVVGRLSGHSLLLIFGALAVSSLVAFLVHATLKRITIEWLKNQLRDQQAANAMQRNFVSMTSHEFRTPMAIIDSCAQKLNLRASSMKPGDIVERARIIRQSVRRMSDIMETILSVAKLEDGGLRISPAKFSLTSMLREAVSRASEIEPSRIFTLRLDRLPREMEGDAKLLDQVFTNLYSNAIKYSPQSSPIEIDGWTEAGQAVVEVTDHGLGIDEEEVGKLFTRYFRAKTAQGIAGTGIGLYVVKLIVERHGGSVAVRSRKGVGTTFTVRLPLNVVDRAPLVQPLDLQTRAPAAAAA